jgi:hypothetical protein
VSGHKPGVQDSVVGLGWDLRSWLLRGLCSRAVIDETGPVGSSFDGQRELPIVGGSVTNSEAVPPIAESETQRRYQPIRILHLLQEL